MTKETSDNGAFYSLFKCEYGCILSFDNVGSGGDLLQ